MVSVSSEIGHLRRVLVHEPGLEVDRMIPAMMEQLLFDDILYGDLARDEHGRFRRVLQLFGIDVLDSSDLLTRALEQEAAQDWLLDVALGALPAAERRRLQRRPSAELAGALVAGLRSQGRGVEADELYSVPPLPNWCFQRDTQIVLGDGVVFCSMAAPARRREAMLSRAIFRFHPDLQDVPVIYDPLFDEEGAERASSDYDVPHLEGGDVLVFSPDIVAVGVSERTNRTAIHRLARVLGKRDSGPRWMILVEIPRRRAYMHLDTLVTQIDRDACLVYPPVILPGGAEQARVFEVDLRSEGMDPMPRDSLLGSLSAHGVSLEPIPCGGEDLVTQQREQWTDGANVLAVAPGVITLFDRNTATAEQLSQRGFRIIEAEDLLLGREEIDIDTCGRACVLIRSHEISRARGGPHCLTHPLVRDVL